jgi:hypothetical protein
VPPPDTFAISIGDTIANGVPGPGAGNLESPGVQDSYTFTGTGGQQVFFEQLQGLGNQQWSLVAPDGTLLVERRDSFDRGPITLPQAGTYTLTALPSLNNDVTGSYSFTLWNIPAPDAFAISIGDTVANGSPDAGAGNIESPGVRDSYTFAGTSGQELSFDVLAAIAQHWDLIAPDGTVLIDGGGLTDRTITLPQTGIYTLIIGTRDNFPVTGTYSFQLTTP